MVFGIQEVNEVKNVAILKSFGSLLKLSWRIKNKGYYERS